MNDWYLAATPLMVNAGIHACIITIAINAFSLALKVKNNNDYGRGGGRGGDGVLYAANHRITQLVSGGKDRGIMKYMSFPSLIHSFWINLSGYMGLIPTRRDNRRRSFAFAFKILHKASLLYHLYRFAIHARICLCKWHKLSIVVFFASYCYIKGSRYHLQISLNITNYARMKNIL